MNAALSSRRACNELDLSLRALQGAEYAVDIHGLGGRH
jgi:hypothetical protein